MNKINFLVIGSKCASKEIITNTFSMTPKASETIMDVNINIFEDDQITLKNYEEIYKKNPQIQGIFYICKKDDEESIKTVNDQRNKIDESTYYSSVPYVFVVLNASDSPEGYFQPILELDGYTKHPWTTPNDGEDIFPPAFMFVANNISETEESLSGAFENMDFSDFGLTAEDEEQIAREMDSLFHM